MIRNQLSLDDTLKKKIYITLLVILLLLFAVSFLENISKDGELNNLKQNLQQLDLKNQKFKTELTSKGDSLSVQRQIILSQKEAINNGLIEIKRLKNIKSKVQVVTKTKVDSIFIPYNQIVFDSTSRNEIPKFKSFFNYKDPKDWYSINGFANQKGITIDSLWVKNDYSIYIADKKIGLFKKAKPSVLLVNKNPYTETIKMNNVVIKYDKPFYKKNWFWIAIGAVGGILIMR
jgi:phage antirepressor YoqD-like protein